MRKHILVILSLVLYILIMFCSCGMESIEIENNLSQPLREIRENSQLFEETIHDKCIQYEILSLNELTRFEWDRVYFFPPYTSVEKMYAKIGYNWGKLPRLSSEDQMAIVFLKDGKVTCDFFGYSGCFSMYSSKKELYAKDDPKFVVASLINNKPQLWWIDSEMVNTLDCPALDIFIGEWEYTTDEPWSIRYSLTITREGLAYGYMHYSIGEIGSQPFDYGSANYFGYFHNGFINCNPFGERIGWRSNSERPADTCIAFSALRITISNNSLVLYAEGIIPKSNGGSIAFSHSGYFQAAAQ